jgi:6-pyruvoyl-tetrahydropterin synthase
MAQMFNHLYYVDEKDIEKVVRKVLDRYTDRQINLASDSSKEVLASEIALVLIDEMTNEKN